MTKRGITNCLLTIGLMIYLIVAVSFAGKMAESSPCRGISISVADNAMKKFVTAESIDAELGGITASRDSMKASDYDLQAIEDRLAKVSNIESSKVYRRGDDVIQIDVVPMNPVARVFSDSGSYYLNSDGKRLTASNRYRIDVPVIAGNLDSHPEDVKPLLGLLAKIEANPAYRSLVTSIRVTPARDIILVPAVRGHLINFGDADDADDKFARVAAFYKKVLPVKGWNYYDTISVKFRGQIVGHIAPGKAGAKYNEFSNEDYDEDIDIDAMTAETTTPDDIKTRL